MIPSSTIDKTERNDSLTNTGKVMIKLLKQARRYLYQSGAKPCVSMIKSMHYANISSGLLFISFRVE